MDDKGRYVWIDDEEYSYLPGKKNLPNPNLVF